MDAAKGVAWNRKLVSSQLTQGVLLGESIPKIARRVQRVTGSNYAAAVRTARTTVTGAVTGAECAGRMRGYQRTKEMNIKLQKEWLATLDNRTRHSHRQLDGQKIPNEEGATFDNGCRYSSDPQGRYDEICNCRCTLVAAIEGVDTSDAERWSRLPDGMTYEEWKAGGSGKKAVEPIARQSRDSESAFVYQPRKMIEKIRASVREYIDAQRVFGLTAPGFSPRRRSTVQLPKAEYASVMSAINESYKARFEGKTKGRIAVGNYSYSFEISGFNEYRIAGRRHLK